MKKNRRHWVIALLLLAAVVAVLVITCPSHDEHCAAVTARLTALHQQGGLDDNAVVCWDFSGVNAQAQSRLHLSPEIMQTLIGADVKDALRITNQGVCSVGSMGRGDSAQHVSLGIGGHVFCTL